MSRAGERAASERARRRILSARPDDRALDLERSARLDELSETARIAAWVTVALRRVRIPRSRCTVGPEERVTCVAAVELARVVVECKQEAGLVDGMLA